MQKDKAVEEAIELREELKEQGMTDRHKKIQPSRPDVDEKLVNVEIEMLFSYDEPDGFTSNVWCQGTMVAVEKSNKVHTKWHDTILREGDIAITEETLLKSKYHKNVLDGWRYSLD